MLQTSSVYHIVHNVAVLMVENTLTEVFGAAVT